MFMRLFVSQSNQIPQKLSAFLIFKTDSKELGMLKRKQYQWIFRLRRLRLPTSHQHE